MCFHFFNGFPEEWTSIVPEHSWNQNRYITDLVCGLGTNCFFSCAIFWIFLGAPLHLQGAIPPLNISSPCALHLQCMSRLLSFYFRKQRASIEHYHGRRVCFTLQLYFLYRSAFSWLWNSQSNLTLRCIMKMFSCLLSLLFELKEL